MDSDDETDDTIQEITDMLAFYAVNTVSHAQFIGLRLEDFLDYMKKQFECYEEFKNNSKL